MNASAQQPAEHCLTPPAGAAPSSSRWLDCIRWDERGLVPAIAQDARSGRVLMVAWMNREALAETVRTGRAVYWSRSRQRLWRKGETSGNQQQVLELRTDCDRDVLLLAVQQAGGVACHTGRESCFFHRLNDAGQWQAVDPVRVDPGLLYAQPASQAASVAESTGQPDAPAAPKPKPPSAFMIHDDDGVAHAQPKAAVAAKDRRQGVVQQASAAGMLGQLADVIESRRGGDPARSYVARLLAGGNDRILKKIGEEATETVMAAKDGVQARIVAETADLWFHSLVMLAHHQLRPEDVIAELLRREGVSGLDEKAARPTS